MAGRTYTKPPFLGCPASARALYLGYQTKTVRVTQARLRWSETLVGSGYRQTSRGVFWDRVIPKAQAFLVLLNPEPA